MLLRRRARGEGGAVAVEAALVTLPLFLLVMGILEISFLARGVTAASSAVAAGARSASVSAAAGPCAEECTATGAFNLGEITADAIARSGTALSSSRVDWVMVYRADRDGLPASQRSQDVDFDPTKCVTDCLLYRESGGRLRFQPSSSWNTTLINACLNDRDRFAVGVAIQVEHRWFTGFFGDGYRFTQHNVMQFEPLPTESCRPGEHQ